MDVPDERTAPFYVPFGRRVPLPGRGQTYVRESGDPAKPTLLLVHGWMASGAINWATAFQPLAEHFHVLAVDLRGHGRGVRTRHRFRLEDCVDDLGALLEELRTGPVIVVGYSMGGIVAQELWHRWPDLVAGLVLCSTTRSFSMGPREQYVFTSLMTYGAGTVRLGRSATIWYRAGRRVRARWAVRERPETLRRWAAAEMRRHDMRLVLEAGRATCRFDSSRWIGRVDVPTAVVLTTRDRAMRPEAQRGLAAAIPEASVYEVNDDHTAFLHPPFAPALVAACLDVAGRAAAVAS